MRTSLLLVNAIALMLLASTAQASQSLDRALELAKAKAYRSKHVDWIDVERRARLIETAQSEDAAIQFVVSALADKHTSYKAPTSSSPTSSRQMLPQPEIATTLPSIDQIPVLQINRWGGKDPQGATRAVRSELNEIMRQQPCGLVLDFSANSGGNMWPMLVGLSPLLSEGPLGAFRSAGGATNRIEKINGLVTMSGKPHFLNFPPLATPLGSAQFIAIVIGDKSSSSGEITPLMFFGQENVMYFGRKTSGFTSANQVFPLPNGGSLVLTTSMTEDRNGHEHPDGIEPNITSDQPFADASKWLTEKCSG